jgi:hypothetical protein
MSSGRTILVLYTKKLAGTPIINGVGANNNCSVSFMHRGSNGITGNMYSNGYNMLTNAIILIVRALQSDD